MHSKSNKTNRLKKQPKPTSVVTEADRIKRAVQWCFPEDIFANLKLHGNVSWAGCVPGLIALAVLTAWGTETRLTDSFIEARKLSGNLFGNVAIATYQGLVRALATYSSQLLPIVWMQFQHLIETTARSYFQIGGWLAIAVDGSRVTTPRTVSNENAFAAKNYGTGKMAQSRRKWKNKKKRSKKLSQPVKPQIWVTLLWHMGTKLPWCWKTGPSNSSERQHLLELLKQFDFPEKTLFCGDAGFTGYEFWSGLLAAGHQFLIRVGGNVKLLKNLGHTRTAEGIVFLWPSQAARKNQPPIVLRLIEVKSQRGTMYLVTSVLDDQALSNTMVKQMYLRRWGVEVQFRAAKQTFGLGKLRSRNSEHALVELNWSLVALTAVQLLALKEQSQLDTPPENSSVGQALRAVRFAMRHWHATLDDQSLPVQLGNAVLDRYQRSSSKTARYKPNFKEKPTATKPKILVATGKQRKAYQALKLAN
jgi:hypothetical protein